MVIQIIGVGRFGLLLVRHFLESGFEVSAWDTRFESGPSEEWAELERIGCSVGIRVKADVVIFAMFPEEIKIASLDHPSLNFPDSTPLVVNVTSVQQPGLDSLRFVDKRRVLSFHTLFGPQAIKDADWKGQKMIVTLVPM